jgi:hypothetical protein
MPRHHPQMGRIKLSFCSETASIKLKARANIVYLVTYDIRTAKEEVMTHVSHRAGSKVGHKQF